MKHSPDATPITPEQSAEIAAALAGLTNSERVRAYQRLYMKAWRAANREIDRKRGRAAMKRYRASKQATANRTVEAPEQ